MALSHFADHGLLFSKIDPLTYFFQDGRVMTKDAKVNLLKTDVQAWNNWKRMNCFVWHDLSGAQLSKAVLVGADFGDTTLDGANLNGANLSEANFQGTHLFWNYHERSGFVSRAVHMGIARRNGLHWGNARRNHH